MFRQVTDSIKEPLLGVTASGALLGISFQNVLEWLQLVSVICAIVVAILTAYLTHIKIKNEKNK